MKTGSYDDTLPRIARARSRPLFPVKASERPRFTPQRGGGALGGLTPAAGPRVPFQPTESR
jgi:hypothetical protein